MPREPSGDSSKRRPARAAPPVDALDARPPTGASRGLSRRAVARNRSPARAAAQDARTPRWLGLTLREHAWLVAVFVLALGLRTWHWWGQMQHNPFFFEPTMDEGMHHEWAQRIASGGSWGNGPFFRAPLYYYLLGWFYALTDTNIAAARWGGALLGALTCYLLAHLGLLLGGFRIGLVAGLLAAVYWPLIHFDSLLLTPGLEIFLNTAMLLSLWLAVQRRSLLPAGLAGLALGLSAVTRPNVLAFAPVVVLWILLGPRWVPTSRAAGLPRPWTQLALAVLGAAIAIAPVTLHNRMVGGEWVLIATNGGVNFYIGNNPEADGVAAIVPGTRADWQGGYEDTQRIPELELGRAMTPGETSNYWFRRGMQWIVSDPLAWMRLTWHKFRLLWTKVEVPNNQPIRYFTRLSPSSALYWIGFPVIAPLALVGLALLRRDWRRWSLPLLFGLVYMSTVVLFFCPARYRLPVVPVLILPAALTLVRGTELLRRWRAGTSTPAERKRLAWGLALGAGGLLFVATNPPPLGLHRRESTGRAYQDLAGYNARQWVDAPNSPSAIKYRDAALEYLARALELRPNDASLRVDRGALLLKFGQREAAGQELERALELDARNPLALGYYGDFLWSRGDLARAAEMYRAALRRNPTWVAPMVALGHILPLLDDTSAGCDYLRAAVRIAPEQLDARQQLATLLLRNGDYAGAAEQLREVLARQRGNAAATHRLSVALHQLGDDVGAVSVLRDGLTENPDDERLLRMLAWFLATSKDPRLAGHLTEAVACAQRAVGVTEGKKAAPRGALAVALGESGDLDAAIHEGEAALALAREEAAVELIRDLEPRIASYRAAKGENPLGRDGTGRPPTAGTSEPTTQNGQ